MTPAGFEASIAASGGRRPTP